jgi:cephalosporin-C deacetylase-like acetyl esterase
VRGRSAVGLSDSTCPPAGGWCAFNALASEDKKMKPVPGMPHAVDSKLNDAMLRWVYGVAEEDFSPAPGR